LHIFTAGNEPSFAEARETHVQQQCLWRQFLSQIVEITRFKLKKIIVFF
jgi:hypothetical protein